MITIDSDTDYAYGEFLCFMGGVRNKSATPPVHREIIDRFNFDRIVIANPHFHAPRAEKGMWLSRNGTVTMHIQYALCGYQGDCPELSLAVLTFLGIPPMLKEDWNDLSRAVLRNRRVELFKNPALIDTWHLETMAPVG